MNRTAIARLPRSVYARGTVEVARDLLGKAIRHGTACARIVETEAYLGTGDAAAHSARGPTPRTKVIFGPPGHAYVYLIYGMHYCLNIVAEPAGLAGCVLIRAVEPVGAAPPVALASNGPGKLTRALGITLDQYGADLTRGPITLHHPADHEPLRLRSRHGSESAKRRTCRCAFSSKAIHLSAASPAADDQNFARDIVR